MRTTFDVLADPTRRRLLRELSIGDRSVGTLVDLLDVSQPTVSKHLKVLREAGLASVHPDGQRRIYRLNPEGFAPVDAWMRELRARWDERVDSLEETLARLKGDR